MQRTYKRVLWKRLSPVGWMVVALGLALGGLALYAGLTWIGQNWSWDLNLARPTPTAVAWGTATPIPATARPTQAATPAAAFPATWAATMYQDEAGAWWPADVETVTEQIKQQYLEWYDHAAGPYDQLLNTVTITEARHYQSDAILEGWRSLKEAYQARGEFPQVVQVVTQHNLLVNDFSPDGLACTVADTYVAGYHLRYNAGQWERVNIPDDGFLDGVQYLGVSLITMRYDGEDGRWKAAASLKFVPRP